MKIITTLTLFLILASCSKKASDTNEPPKAAYVTGVTWSPVYAGASMSIAFSVNMVIVSPVTKVNLYNAQRLASELKNPQTKTYTMYDHAVQSMPTYPAHQMYHFEFIMADGTKILTEPFQVY